MATYAIGDVQGCYDQLRQLLDLINYDQSKDSLWFCGDLVNRGPKSLKTLRFIKSLPQENIVITLGNHDLGMLAIEYGGQLPPADHTMHDIFAAEDKHELYSWLRNQSLLHYAPELNATICHAGIYPLWELNQALNYASIVEKILQDDAAFQEFSKVLYGEHPTKLDINHSVYEQARFIINVFTRMRFLDLGGNLILSTKVSPNNNTNKQLIPWYLHPKRKAIPGMLFFGHWAALNGQCEVEHIFALDTGCVWGNCLTAICIEQQQKYQISCN